MKGKGDKGLFHTPHVTCTSDADEVALPAGPCPSKTQCRLGIPVQANRGLIPAGAEDQ